MRPVLDPYLTESLQTRSTYGTRGLDIQLLLKTAKGLTGEIDLIAVQNTLPMRCNRLQKAAGQALSDASKSKKAAVATDVRASLASADTAEVADPPPKKKRKVAAAAPPTE